MTDAVIADDLNDAIQLLVHGAKALISAIVSTIADSRKKLSRRYGARSNRSTRSALAVAMYCFRFSIIGMKACALSQRPAFGNHILILQSRFSKRSSFA